jgi:hypothetical protein
LSPNLAQVYQLVPQQNKDTIFAFLGLFEENPVFKLIYEENKQQIDLSKISEMLKAEPIIENGWIQRFSQEIK